VSLAGLRAHPTRLNRLRWLAIPVVCAGTCASLLAQSRGTSGPTAKDARLADEADRIVAAFVQRDEFMGSVLVARQGAVVFRKASKAT